MRGKYFYLYLFSFLLLLSSVGGAFSAVLKEDVPPSCDVEMMDLMNINAGKSGRRDVELAQRIILKPDSTLEYTCFHNEISRAGGTSDFLNTDTYNEYLVASFGAKFGGGTYVYSGSGGGGTGCKAMNLVWDFLKCENFNDNNYTGTDIRKTPFFLTFTQLADKDPRAFPLACSSSTRDDKWKKDNEDSDVGKVLADTDPSVE